MGEGSRRNFVASIIKESAEKAGVSFIASVIHDYSHTQTYQTGL